MLLLISGIQLIHKGFQKLHLPNTQYSLSQPLLESSRNVPALLCGGSLRDDTKNGNKKERKLTEM